MFEKSLDSESVKKELQKVAMAPGHYQISPKTSLDGILREDPEAQVPYFSAKEHPASFDLASIMKDPKKVVDAQIVECDRGGRYRMVRYDKNGLYQRLNNAPIIEATPTQKLSLMEAVDIKYGNLREDSFDTNSYLADASTTSEPFANFTPLFMGPYYRNQFMYKMLELKSKCYEAFNNNPVAHRIPNLITQFTLGKGVTAVCKDDKTRKAWDAFAKLNRIGTSMNVGLTRAGSRLRMWSNQLSVDGELMLQFKPTKEGLKMQYIDSATILDIVTDPEDIDKVKFFHQQFNTPFQMYTKNGIDGMRYIIRDIPGPEVLHVKINVYENEKRGRSDLASIIGWLKRLKDLINANVIKAYFQACYTWDYEIDGSPATVSTIAQAFQSSVPTPGSAYFHNKNIKRTPNPPAGGVGAGADQDMMGLMNMISMGSGLPPAYLIGSMSQNRANILAETEPSAKFFFERQSIWDEALHCMFERLSRWTYDQTGQMLDDNIEFSFPVVTAVERNAYIASLDAMVTSKRFTAKRAAELAAKEFCVTSYNYKDEQKDIVEETKESMQRELELNKIKSAAQSHLSLWQNLLSDSSAQETADTLGPDSPSMQPDPQQQMAQEQHQMQMQQGAQASKGGKPSGSKAKPSRPKSSGGSKAPAKHGSGARDKARSGGISEQDRARTGAAVKANAHS